MTKINLITTALPLANAAAGEEESSSFLVSPSWGLMIWTLITFGIVFLILTRYALPKIQAAIDYIGNSAVRSVLIANLEEALDGVSGLKGTLIHK